MKTSNLIDLARYSMVLNWEKVPTFYDDYSVEVSTLDDSFETTDINRLVITASSINGYDEIDLCVTIPYDYNKNKIRKVVKKLNQYLYTLIKDDPNFDLHVH